jgi:hypothetical protein
MIRIHVTALLALSTLALPVSFARGQQIFSGGGTAPTSSQGTTGKDVPHCQAAPGGSRMRGRKAEDDCVAAAETAVRAEQQSNVKLEVPQPEALQCEATTLTEYSQRNSVARVTGTVSIANCPAGSAGTFDVVARVKDESGEIKPIEFPEKWQRDDAEDVSFTGDYPIGDNVELSNVRVRNLKCTCAAAPEGAAQEAAATATTPTN